MGGLRPEINEIEGVIQPRYWLKVDDREVLLDPEAQPGLHFTYSGNAACQHCGNAIRAERHSGYCYACFTTLARCDLCVMAPERCHAHLNTCREPAWGEQFCMQPHVVYVANSSQPKVGITRAERSVGRWVDQGATAGMVIADVPTRRAAGIVEHHLKSRVADRTDWRKLVSGYTQPGDLMALGRELQDFCGDLTDIANIILPADEQVLLRWREPWQITAIEYPVKEYAQPERIQIDGKTPTFRGNLCGIVGRYLLFPTGALAVDDHQFGDIIVEIGPTIEDERLPQTVQGSLF